MSETGCEVGNDFSPQQLEAIELFATGELNCTGVAEQLGVTVQTISQWRSNQQFMKAIYNRAKEILKDALPEIYKVTKLEAKKGSAPHIKILLDHLDNLEKTMVKNNQASITFTWDINANSDTLPTA